MKSQVQRTVRVGATQGRYARVYPEGDFLNLLLPQPASEDQLRFTVDRLLFMIEERQALAPPSDPALEERARRLNADYFDGRFSWWSIHYVDRWPRRRVGRCDALAQVISLNRRVAELSDELQDYALAHELVHLHHHNHGPEFWATLACLPEALHRHEQMLDWMIGS